MRIAWIGPMPTDEGGAGGVSAQLLVELDKRGIEVHCFFPGDEKALPAKLRRGSLRFFCQPSNWQWGRWYSKNQLMCFITGQLSNLRCEHRLASVMLQRHREKPYDVVYQFSHIEMSAIRKIRKYLPPIVLHPSVHAAGELRWLKNEAHIMKQTESLTRRVAVKALLSIRASVQRYHIRYPDMILGLSRTFAQEMIRDYGISEERMRIVPNSIDTIRFHPKEINDLTDHDAKRKLVLLFVSRLSVRKGLEMIVELSHRLEDLRHEVELKVVGDRTLWSDYTPLLKHLNPNTATYIGSVPGSGSAMTELYQSADMLIQPSHYEPFGLTVPEALACGTPVIASDQVGSVEGMSSDVCRVYCDGDMNALERETRRLIHDIKDPTMRQRMARLAQAEVGRLYTGGTIAERLIDCLREAAGFVSKPGRTASTPATSNAILDRRNSL